MNRQAMDQVMVDHFTYEAQDDVDGVLSTLTDDVVHEVVGAPWTPLTGTDAVRPMYEQLFQNLKGTGVEPVTRWYGDGFVVDDTIWSGRIEDGGVFGFPGRSGNVSFRLLHVFEFRGDLISKEVVWCDTVTIGRQLD